MNYSSIIVPATLGIGVAIVCWWFLRAVLSKYFAHQPEFLRGCWEVIPARENEETIGYQVRWSIPDEKGRYLWVGHYFEGGGISLMWCRVAADNHCLRLNKEGKLPFEWQTGTVPMWREI